MLTRQDVGTVGDLPVITREKIESIASQLTDTISGRGRDKENNGIVEEVESLLQPLVNDYVVTVESVGEYGSSMNDRIFHR